MKASTKVYSFESTEKEAFGAFLRKYQTFQIVDLFKEFWIQLYGVRHPKVYFSKDAEATSTSAFDKELSNKPIFSLGAWVVFEAEQKIYHLLTAEDHLELRTARNRGLLSIREQNNLYSASILVLGLSVGSQVAMSLVRLGVGKHITLVDPDVVELHNCNRTTFFITDIGRKKVDVVVSQLLKIDPFLSITSHGNKLSDHDLEELVSNTTIIIDAFDDFPQKVELRKVAKKYKKPIVSGFDIERGVMAIVERYDQGNVSPHYFFNTSNPQELLKKDASMAEKIDKFIAIIGEENHSPRMLKAVRSLGKELTGVPQLIIATTLAASMWTSCVVDILLNSKTQSIRKYLDLQKSLHS